MEFKHFSHNHNLIFQQLPQGRDIQCSGCKSPGSGSVYACWQCSYFLHEQCFRATRSLKNHLHPLHPLTLVPYPTHPSNSFYCNSCNLIGSGFSYCCSECEFDLHIHCAMNPNTTIHHPPQIPYLNQNYSPIPQPSVYPPVQYNQPPPPNEYPGNFTHHNQPPPPPPPQPHAYQENIAPPYNPAQNIAPPVNFQQTPAPPPSGYPGTSTAPPVNHQQNPAPPPSGYPGTSTAPPADQVQPVPQPVQTTYVPNPGNQPQQNKPIPVFPSPGVTVQIQLAAPTQPKVEGIKHFSHDHGLKLAKFEKQDAKKCGGCLYPVDGEGYTCVEPQCNYYLDKTCFEAPTEIRHKSHLDHPLTLLAKSRYEGGEFACNACVKEGSGFVYNCATCGFDLHADCTAWPESIKREDHTHPLTLFYASPIPKAEGQQEVTFVCDVCHEAVHDMAWTYYCHECDFGTHLECVINQVRPVEKSEEEKIQEAALKLKVLQLLLSGDVKFT